MAYSVNCNPEIVVSISLSADIKIKQMKDTA